MRVISQDGTIDIPYDSVIIQRFGREIYFLNKNLIGVEQLVSDMDIATYSTEEKAEKAMEMLQNDYYDHVAEKTYHEGAYYIHPYSNFQKMKMWRFSICRT